MPGYEFEVTGHFSDKKPSTVTQKDSLGAIAAADAANWLFENGADEVIIRVTRKMGD